MPPIVTAILLAAAAFGADAVAPQLPEETDLPLLVFVGEQVSIEEAPDPCAVEPDEDVLCVSMDSLYRARYRIRERIAGAPSGEVVEFTVADHYGFPHFAERRTALLYVTMDPQGPYLQKYQGFPVARTADGDWGFCGSPGDHPGAGEPALVPLQFVAPEMPVPLGFSKPGIDRLIGQFGLDRDEVEIVDGHAWCRRGVRLAALHAWVANGVLAARGFDPRDLGVAPAKAEASDQATRP